MRGPNPRGWCEMPKPKFERIKTLDPAVADLLDNMQERQADRQLTKGERRKKARQQEKDRERKAEGTRFQIDLPKGIKALTLALADREHLPASQIIALALVRFLEDVDAGRVDLSEYKRPSKSPRYDWTLEIPEIRRK